MNKTHLNLDIFLQELLKEMDQQDNEELKKLMQEELADGVLRAVSLNVDPLLIDEIDNRFPEETSLEKIYQEMISASPMIQVAVLEALEAFRQEMLESAQ